MVTTRSQNGLLSSGRSAETPPRDAPSSPGFCGQRSPFSCSSWFCWFWPAWFRCLKTTTAARWPTTSPAPSTRCCATRTDPRPHECRRRGDTSAGTVVVGSVTNFIGSLMFSQTTAVLLLRNVKEAQNGVNIPVILYHWNIRHVSTPPGGRKRSSA